MATDSELAVFRAIADPTRRRLLEALRAGPRSVNRLAESFPVSRPAISKHLRLLRQAGLVSEERRGRQRIYHLQPQALGDVRGWVDTFAAAPPASAAAPGRRRRAAGREPRPAAPGTGDWRVW
jgi:DNA-binding transcriptional ArsR family regulator